MPLVTVRGKSPVVHGSAYIAPTAWVVGDVRLGSESSVWFNAVLRGDLASILVGDDTNIQDCVIIHPDRRSALIGSRVTIGHSSVLEGVVVEDEVLVGIRSTILEGARIGRGSVVAAGSLIPAGMEVPPGSFVAGSPARVVGRVRANLVRLIHESWREYSELKNAYIGEPGL